MEIIPWGGWDECAALTSGQLTVILPLAVGPRVLSLTFENGQNHFRVNPAHQGLTHGHDYRSYGGHRIWIAPESRDITYQPENCPLAVGQDGSWTTFRNVPDAKGFVKELACKPCPSNSLAVRHRILNTGANVQHIAPWAVTVMAPGGTCFFPQAQFEPHAENFLPVRPLVLWSYTNMEDPRWSWGEHVIRLQQTESPAPQKVGALLNPGIAAYTNFGQTFLKSFAAIANASYPDMGCNFETYTRHDLLEVESLGPLRLLEPGGHVDHVEIWRIVNEVPPSRQLDCWEWLMEHWESMNSYRVAQNPSI